MKEKIKRWYEGEYIPFKNDPGSGVFIFGGHSKRHWTATATATRWAVEFYMREWK
jgi:hypothetical protein